MPSTAPAESDLQALESLGWVLDELRHSLDGATRAIRRFVRDTEPSKRDASHLRLALQQLHQALGVLEMVGMATPAKLLHAMEASLQKLIQQPELCNEDVALRIERASLALSDYLAGLLKGAPGSSVALFPQYRALLELSAAERIHPADLWPPEWHWLSIETQVRVAPLPYVREVRAVLDQAVLKIVKTADPQAASRMAQLCAGLSAGQSQLEPRSFWAIAAGYFQAMGLSLLPVDVYTKRTASRMLQQYAALAQGDSGPSKRLAQDLVFFCGQAQPPAGVSAPALTAVRAAYGLTDSASVDYQTEQFGRLDPAQLAPPSVPEPQAPLAMPVAAVALDFPPEPLPSSGTLAQDEQTKVIGELSLSIALYNVYLNEADEWSRHLMTELGEWALELHRPLAESTLRLAHSLGGASATVGFEALTELARTLEQALQQVQLHGQGTALQAQVLNHAAEDIRRLLHQFAAGFIKTADPQVLQQLRQLIATEWVEPNSERSDPLDADLFPIFQEEAADLMPALGVALRQWVARPDNPGARAEALRLLHTLKGSARLAGAMRLGELAHGMESDIEALGAQALHSRQREPLLAQLDGLYAQLAALSLAPDMRPLPSEPEPSTPDAQAVAHQAAQRWLEQPGPTLPRHSGQSVRVRSQLLDRLLNQAGEVMMSRSRMEGHIAQMRGSLLELSRMMVESVNDVATVQRSLQRSIEGLQDDLVAQGRQALELQRDLLRTRMVEFESIAERLYGVVRQAAKAEAKQVRLDIVGGSIEIDRGVLDRMTPAFEHMLRNAVAHGIEPAAQRVAAGKPEQGSITVSVRQEGNNVSVSFVDDGAGLHLEQIHARAVAAKLIAPDAALSEVDSARLLFAPGFSTATAITELSGRGIGMDVVLTELHALGGTVETSTVVGKGTSFRLILPLTAALAQVLPNATAQTPVDGRALVLVVDGSITVRRVTQRLLQREGFRVALAHDGLHALELLAQEKPAVLLTDIEMPRMDGFGLVRAIRADAQLRDLPVIMITSRMAHRDHAAELGVNHYLGKPYSEDQLLALIRSTQAVNPTEGYS